MRSVHPYEKVFARIDNVEPTAWGWKGRCPSHEDRHNSLSITITEDDGRLLLKCHAGHGCTFGSVCDAIGIKASDCFPPQEKKMNIAKTYDYCFPNGDLNFQVVRFDPKDFRQRRKAKEGDPPEAVKGDWVWSLRGVARTLYRLEVLANADPNRVVFVFEDEGS